jgi:hypothetical protein
MSTQPKFWLYNFADLVNLQNFTFFSDSGKQKWVKILNLIAISFIIIGIVLTVVNKNKSFLGICMLLVTSTIFLNSAFVKNMSSFKSKFSKAEPINTNYSNSYDTGVYLVKAVTQNDPSALNNSIYVNNAMNFNKGDIIALSSNGTIMESNVVSDIQYTVDSNKPVILLLNPLKKEYSKYTTKILKVSDSTPNIIAPPDPNISIQAAQNLTGTIGGSDPDTMAVANYPSFKLPNADRYDWDLELSTYGGMEPGQPPNYQYQGQPYGNLKCRSSDLDNPMGTINVTEYDSAPTMYGTCNVGEDNNDYKMTSNQEATVSQRVDDLLFHKGNSQSRYSPMPVDTLPNDQEAFAHFCYRNPTNLVNPKYASIFVNDPEKFKLVSKLARATGTENGGGGGGH